MHTKAVSIFFCGHLPSEKLLAVPPLPAGEPMDLSGYSTMVRYCGGARAIGIQLGTEAILDRYEDP